MNEPKACIKCHMQTVLTCAHCMRALCSYCQEDNPLCLSCRPQPPQPRDTGISLFARLNQEAQTRYASFRGGNQCL